MLGNTNQTTSRDTIFGDFEVIDYGEIGNRYDMSDFFLDLWRRKGGEEKKISRADVSPVEMKKYLEHVVLMDVVHETGGWRLVVRLIGGHVANFYGEITGKDIREMENSKAIERIYYVSGQVMEHGLPLMTVSPAFSPDRLYMEAIAIYLPLFDGDGKVNKIMVAVHVSAPRRS